MNTITATSQMLQTPQKATSYSTAAFTDSHFQQSSHCNAKQTAQMLSAINNFAKDLGLDLLIAIRGSSHDGVTTLSSDPVGFSLEQAAKLKLVRKLSVSDEKECAQAVRNMLTDSNRTKHLLESATTVSSSVSETLNTVQERYAAANSLAAKTDLKMGKLASEVNFANMMRFDDDDDEINGSVIQGSEPDQASEDEHPISSICNSDSPAECCDKFLAHTRSNFKQQQFCDPVNVQGRNLFAQKHLFKSGLKGENQPENCESDGSEDASFEADLTDPVSQSRSFSNVESPNSGIDDSQCDLENSESHCADEDVDQLDFMFLACADWEKIVEDENAQEVTETSTKAADAGTFAGPAPLKREVKADLKEQKGNCTPFEAQCEVDTDAQMNSPNSSPSLDIDSMMKTVLPCDRSRKRRRNSSPSKKVQQSSPVGIKRSCPQKAPSALGFKRSGTFSSPADLFKRTDKSGN